MASPGENLKAGADFMGDLTAAERKTAAYNVLNATYGAAVADDPANALNAQLYGQREKTNPLDVTGKQLDNEGKVLGNQGSALDNTGKQQTNDYNFLANPKKLQGLDLANEGAGLQNEGQGLTNTKTAQDTQFAAQEQPLKLAEKRANINQSNAAAESSRSSTAVNRFALNTAEAAAQRTATVGILAGLSDVAAQGGDIGAAFDQYAPQIAQLQGVRPEALGALKARLVQDPVGTINTLTQAISAANDQALAGKAGGARALAAGKDAEKAASQVLGMKNIAERTATVPLLVDQAKGLISGFSPVAAVRAARAKIPGTNEYQYEKLMESLTANLALTDLQSMKASGLSLGRVTNAEMLAAGHAYANMGIGQDTGTIRSNLDRMNDVYKTVNGNLAVDIQRLEKKASGGSSAGKLQAPIPAPAGFKGIEGKTYTDKDGNSAIFKNGKFIPQ